VKTWQGLCQFVKRAIFEYSVGGNLRRIKLVLRVKALRWSKERQIDLWVDVSKIFRFLSPSAISPYCNLSSLR
jgi:hypothetical protein